jgi:uncharacterized Zn finger protein (UPF0148 family)
MGLTAQERRELYKKEMAERHKESADSKGDSGRFRDIFDPRKKAGVTFWKCSEDDHEMYIVPFVTGKQHPTKKEGHTGINVMPFVHRGIGVNEDSYICLNRTYNERCPICEYQKELRESTDKDVEEKTVKALSPTRRSIYLIVCLDSSAETKKGVQVWDVSSWLFTEPLDELAEKKKGGGKVLYADDTVGKIISFRKKGSKRNTEYTAFELKDRAPIADDILESAPCLDELLHKPTYEEVSNAFFAKPEKEEESGKQEEQSAPEKEKDVPASVTQGSERKVLTKAGSAPAPAPVPERKVYTDCPNGAAFGTDHFEYEECRTCEAEEDCKNKLAEITAAAAAKAEPAQPERKKLTRRDK